MKYSKSFLVAASASLILSGCAIEPTVWLEGEMKDDATVFVDGKEVELSSFGGASVSFPNDGESHTIRVERPGYKSQEQVVDCDPETGTYVDKYYLDEWEEDDGKSDVEVPEAVEEPPAPEPAPAADEPAVEEPPAPEPAPATDEEPAPAVDEEPVIEEPEAVDETPAPAADEEPAPATDEEPVVEEPEAIDDEPAPEVSDEEPVPATDEEPVVEEPEVVDEEPAPEVSDEEPVPVPATDEEPVVEEPEVTDDEPAPEVSDEEPVPATDEEPSETDGDSEEPGDDEPAVTADEEPAADDGNPVDIKKNTYTFDDIKNKVDVFKRKRKLQQISAEDYKDQLEKLSKDVEANY